MTPKSSIKKFFIFAIIPILILLGVFALIEISQGATVPIRMQTENNANFSTTGLDGGGPSQDASQIDTAQFLGSGYELNNEDFTLDIGMRLDAYASTRSYFLLAVPSGSITSDNGSDYYVTGDLDSYDIAEIKGDSSSNITDLGSGVYRLTFENITVDVSETLVIGMVNQDFGSGQAIFGSTSTVPTGLGDINNAFYYTQGSNFGETPTPLSFYTYMVVGDVLNVSNFSIDIPSDIQIFGDFPRYSYSFDKSGTESGIVYALYDLRNVTDGYDIPLQAGNTAFVFASSTGANVFDNKEASLSNNIGDTFTLTATLYQFIDGDTPIELASDSHSFTITSSPAQNNFIEVYEPVGSVSDVVTWSTIYQSEDAGRIEVRYSTSTDVYTATSTSSGYSLAGVRSVAAGSSGLISMPNINDLPTNVYDTFHWIAVLYDSSDNVVDYTTSTFNNLGSQPSFPDAPAGSETYNSFLSALSDNFPFDILVLLRSEIVGVDFNTNRDITVSFTDNPAFGTTTYTLLSETTFKNNLGGSSSYDTLRDYVGYFFYFIVCMVLLPLIYKFVIYLTTSDQ